MFDLEERIKEWRSDLFLTGVNEPERLGELENHLREEIQTLLSSGLPEAEAFKIAVSRLGSCALIESEFRKIKGRSWPPLTAVLSLLIAVLGIVLFLVLRNIFAGNMTLLFAHVLSVTAGYFLGLLTGGLGICYVCWRLFDNLTPARLQ